MVADVPALQLLHDQADALLHLLLVGIPSLLHIGDRHSMGAEEDLNLILQTKYVKFVWDNAADVGCMGVNRIAAGLALFLVVLAMQCLDDRARHL